MFDKILIANRGEIACRVARTARRMGIRTVAVYSDADADALHVAACDEAYRLGPPPPRESYLDGDAIIAIAKQTGAQAIHPGLRLPVRERGLRRGLRARGHRLHRPAARGDRGDGLEVGGEDDHGQGAACRSCPAITATTRTRQLLAREAATIGYPVLIKATAGGGGKGMKIVERAADFAAALASAQREAKAGFGDDRVLIEKYLTAPRHIEIQVFADTHGNAVYLFERDCSVQRRHQKVLEEAPAPGMKPEHRRAMGEAAVAAREGDRLRRRRHRRVHRRRLVRARRRVLLHGDEHAAAGRASGHRDDHRARTSSNGSCASRRASRCRSGRTSSRSTATRSRRASTPRIPTAASCRRSARSRTCARRPTGAARARRHRRARRRRDLAVLRSDDRQADRPRRGPRRRRCAGSPRRSREYEIVGVATNVAFLQRVVAHEAFASGDVDTGLIARHHDALFPPPAPLPRRRAARRGARRDARARRGRAPRRRARRAIRIRRGTRVDPWWPNSARHAIALRVRRRRRAARRRACAATATRWRVTLPARRDRRRASRERDGRLVIATPERRVRRDRRAARRGAPRLLPRRAAAGCCVVDPLAHAGEEEAHGGHLMAPMSGTVVAVMVEGRRQGRARARR